MKYNSFFTPSFSLILFLSCLSSRLAILFLTQFRFTFLLFFFFSHRVSFLLILFAFFFSYFINSLSQIFIDINLFFRVILFSSMEDLPTSVEEREFCFYICNTFSPTYHTQLACFNTIPSFCLPPSFAHKYLINQSGMPGK